MQKQRVLVRDSKNMFLKMFRKTFKENCDFFEKPFFIENEFEIKEFDRVVCVIYDKQELLSLLKEDTKTVNTLVCLFNKQLYRSLSFLESINNLILFDESKTRVEIAKELKSYFKMKPDSIVENNSAVAPEILETRFNDYYKVMYFLM